MADSSGSDEDELTGSKLGRQDYWEKAYVKELTNLRELGDLGEIWFGEDVMETMLGFLDDLLSTRHHAEARLVRSILDVGTGNAVLLLELARMGYQDLTGTDYSEAAVTLASAIVEREGHPEIKLLYDDLLQTKLGRRFDVVVDKGTLDAIGLSADAAANRRLYREAVWKLLQPQGLLVITSCNSTKEELIQEFCSPPDSAQRDGCGAGTDNCDSSQADDAQQSSPSHANGSAEASTEGKTSAQGAAHAAPASQTSAQGIQLHDPSAQPAQTEQANGVHAGRQTHLFEYVDHVRTYPSFRFGGVEGTKVATVAFLKV